MKTILERLLAVCRAYYDKLVQLENEKYDMEKEVEFKDFRVRPPPPPTHPHLAPPPHPDPNLLSP